MVHGSKAWTANELKAELWQQNGIHEESSRLYAFGLQYERNLDTLKELNTHLVMEFIENY
jgi:hypothetical protein